MGYRILGSDDGTRMKGNFQPLIIGILWMLLGVFFSACSEKSGKPAPPLIPVAVSAVIQKTVPLQLQAIGNVQAYSTVTVKSRVPGHITRVYFKEGDDVRNGDLLFLIDPRPFEAVLKQAEANLERDLALVRQAESNLRRGMAQEKNAQADAERYKMLFERGVVSRQQYDKFRTDWEALEATVSAERAALANAEAAVAADRAAAENARLQLSYCSIRTPMNGRTGSLLVQEGNIVKENDAQLVVINQITPVYIVFSVPEHYLGEIKKYMAAGNLRVEAVVPNHESRPEWGIISFIDNSVDVSTGTIRLKGTFSNKERHLWPGQFVNVSLMLTEEPNAIVVPSQAVQTGQEGQYVFVVKQDLTVESRPVITGRAVNTETVIQKGLHPNEKVVTDGQLRLYPGARVEIKASDSTASTTKKTP